MDMSMFFYTYQYFYCIYILPDKCDYIKDFKWKKQIKSLTLYTLWFLSIYFPMGVFIYITNEYI